MEQVVVSEEAWFHVGRVVNVVCTVALWKAAQEALREKPKQPAGGAWGHLFENDVQTSVWILLCRFLL